MSMTARKAYMALLLSVSVGTLAIAAEVNRPIRPRQPPPRHRSRRVRRRSRIGPGSPFRRNLCPSSSRRIGCATPIDAFVLAKIEAKGLTPSPDADRATFIRRATLDAWGLVPTPEEVDAFVKDAVARRLRKARRSPARLAALRRTSGAPLARSRALRRQRRLPERQDAPQYVPLSRLRDQGLQRGQALFTLSSGADRRRRDRARRSGCPRRDRLPRRLSGQQQFARSRSAQVSDHDRHDRHGRPGDSRHDGRLRALPQSQDGQIHPEGLLSRCRPSSPTPPSRKRRPPKRASRNSPIEKAQAN